VEEVAGEEFGKTGTVRGLSPVGIDSLPSETKSDIANNLLKFVPFLANYKSDIYEEPRGYDLQDVMGNLFGMVDEPQVLHGHLPVEPLYRTMGNRSTSDVAVSKYVDRLKTIPEFDPILVDNDRFLDGGHRLEAYHRAGRKSIPVVDIGNLLHAPDEVWKRWMEGDETLTAAEAFPIRRRKTADCIVGQTEGEVDRFRAWFDGSKVVDTEGNPLMVYHGTNASRFRVFKTKGRGRTPVGAFFTDIPEVAASYGRTQHAVYLKIVNPLVINAGGHNWDNIYKDAYIDNEDGFQEDLVSGMGLWGELDENNPISTDDLARIAKEKGHDGLIVRNVKDTGGGGISFPVGSVFAVFSPSQVKSATDNTGEFDPENRSFLASQRADSGFPLAGETVDGMAVGDDIDNMSSIGASFYDYEIEDGIREVPMSYFNTEPRHNFYARNDLERCEALAEEIRESGRIDPLIVGVDKDGPWVLEGGHRLVALHILGKKSFPALVVQDLSDEWIAQRSGKNAAQPSMITLYHKTRPGRDQRIDVEGLDRMEGGGELWFSDTPDSYYPESDSPVYAVEVPAEEAEKGRRGEHDFVLHRSFCPRELTRVAGVSPSELGYLVPQDSSITSPAFRAWFRNSVVKDDYGRPLPVYHGSTHQFEAFNPSRSDIENHYGRGIYFTSSEEDVTRNYATPTGPDITNRIERRTEELINDLYAELGEDFPANNTDEYKDLRADANERAIKELMGGDEGVVYLTYLRIEKPVYVSKDNRKSTWFEINYNERTGKESGSGMRLYNAVLKVSENQGVDGQEIWNTVMSEGSMESEFTAYQFEQAFRSSENLPEDIYINAGDFISQVYRTMGFDGIIQMEPDQQFPGMKLTPGTHHYIIWNPRQVKSAIKNVGTFNPRSQKMTASGPKQGVFPGFDITQTPQFRAWFGDSEVVDEQGKPLVVYHGTKCNFDEFNHEGRGTIHFTSDPAFAGMYSGAMGWSEGKQKPIMQKGKKKSLPIGANIMPCYLKCENLFDFRQSWAAYTAEEYFNSGEMDQWDFKRACADYYEVLEEELTRKQKASYDAACFSRQIQQGSWLCLELGSFIGFIRQQGFDGIVMMECGAINYAVFDPKQVKSAIGNQGGFDPENASITASRRRLPPFDEVHYKYYPDTDSYGEVGFMGGDGVFSENIPTSKLVERYGQRLAERMIRHEGEPIVWSSRTPHIELDKTSAKDDWTKDVKLEHEKTASLLGRYMWMIDPRTERPIFKQSVPECHTHADWCLQIGIPLSHFDKINRGDIRVNEYEKRAVVGTNDWSMYGGSRRENEWAPQAVIDTFKKFYPKFSKYEFYDDVLASPVGKTAARRLKKWVGKDYLLNAGWIDTDGKFYPSMDGEHHGEAAIRHHLVEGEYEDLYDYDLQEISDELVSRKCEEAMDLGNIRTLGYPMVEFDAMRDDEQTRRLITDAIRKNPGLTSVDIEFHRPPDFKWKMTPDEAIRWMTTGEKPVKTDMRKMRDKLESSGSKEAARRRKPKVLYDDEPQSLVYHDFSQLLQNGGWVTSRGKPIAMSDPTDSHGHTALDEGLCGYDPSEVDEDIDYVGQAENDALANGHLRVDRDYAQLAVQCASISKSRSLMIQVLRMLPFEGDVFLEAGPHDYPTWQKNFHSSSDAADFLENL
jgi:hypothetical protein